LTESGIAKAVNPNSGTIVAQFATTSLRAVLAAMSCPLRPVSGWVPADQDAGGEEAQCGEGVRGRGEGLDQKISLASRCPSPARSMTPRT
jgi:hypothetical protein